MGVGCAKVFDADVEPEIGERFFVGVAEPFGRMLAILAGAEEKAAVPAHVGFAANVAAANASGNGGAARLKGNEVVELHGVGDLQPIFAESAEICAGFIGQNDVANFEDRFAAGWIVRKGGSGFAHFRIVAAVALPFERSGIEAVNGENDLVDVPTANFFRRETAEESAVGIEDGFDARDAVEGSHHSGEVIVEDRFTEAAYFENGTAASFELARERGEEVDVHAAFRTIHDSARTVAARKIAMVGEFNGGANGKFSELEEVRFFEIEPVEAFAEGIDVAEFGKIVGN